MGAPGAGAPAADGAAGAAPASASTSAAAPAGAAPAGTADAGAGARAAAGRRASRVRADAGVFMSARAASLPGVGPSRAAQLSRLHISTVRDLLFFFPHRYIDLSHVATCAAAPIGEQAMVVGTVHEVRRVRPRPRLDIVEASIVDETGVLMAVWFRQPWMARRLSKGMRVAVGGTVGFDYGFKRITSPMLEVLSSDGCGPALAFVPVHHATEGLSTGLVRRFVANALFACADIHDPLPASMRRAHGLVNRKAALHDIHFPKSAAARDAARRRLAFEEAFFLQLEMMRRRDAECAHAAPIAHDARAPQVARLLAALPFELTDDQKAAVDEILGDMAAPRIMNRMLIGDVGCGKTVVAACALACAAGSGRQAAMMAPTELLARQYETALAGCLDAAGVRHALLTGSTAPAERARVLSELADGRVQVLFGTHALIEPDVAFSSLSLVVIDEQHRFGVGQRAALREKGPGCDLLTMTATPIPRTLALVCYGDVQTSYIRHRPAGRKPVATEVVSRDARALAYDAIRAAVAEGHQAYIVCPLVGLSSEQRARANEDGGLDRSIAAGRDVASLKAAEDEAAYLSRSVFPEFSVGLLTGGMPAADKRRVMERFAAGEIAVLVATTVVEVGVDVPNATVMMVEDAERFGLAQLHQLRGRVGRGSAPGRFFLVADPGKDDEKLAARLDALCSTDDGFELARLDLESRREGNVFGALQHGASVLRLVDVTRDADVVQAAHAEAAALLEADPGLAAPEHAALAAELSVYFEGVRAGEDEGADGGAAAGAGAGGKSEAGTAGGESGAAGDTRKGKGR